MCRNITVHRALYNSPYRSALLESRDHPFCYEGFNNPGRGSRHSPPAYLIPPICNHSHVRKKTPVLRQDSRHCIQPIGPGQSLRLTHTQDDAEMSPTLASIVLLQRRLDNLSRISDTAPAPTIPDTSHHHQLPAVGCTVPTLPQIHLHE